MVQITEADYDQVLALRQSVMYPGSDVDYVKLDNDSEGIHLGIFDKGQMVGVVSIFMDSGRNVRFRKMAVRADMQRKGYGTMLIKWMIDYTEDVKLNGLWCSARREVAGFYKKQGFEETGQTFERDGRQFVVMRWVRE